jgi:hypothetical protein
MRLDMGVDNITRLDMGVDTELEQGTSVAIVLPHNSIIQLPWLSYFLLASCYEESLNNSIQRKYSVSSVKRCRRVLWATAFFLFEARAPEFDTEILGQLLKCPL